MTNQFFTREQKAQLKEDIGRCIHLAKNAIRLKCYYTAKDWADQAIFTSEFLWKFDLYTEKELSAVTDKASAIKKQVLKLRGE